MTMRQIGRGVSPLGVVLRLLGSLLLAAAPFCAWNLLLTLML